MTIGERIRERRIELNISPKELAEKMGKAVSTYYRYETNEIEKLTIENISILAECLKVSPVYLLFGMIPEDETSVSLTPDKNHYIVNSFSKRFSELKESKNVFSSDIAMLLSARSNYKISDNEVDKWLNGKELPDLISFVTLCELFEVSYDYMLGTDRQYRNIKNNVYRVAETPSTYKKQSILVRNVKKLLDSGEMSESTLAEKTGISEDNIHLYKKGMVDDIPMADVKAIALLFNIPMVDILFKKDIASVISKLSKLDAVDIKIIEDYIDRILTKK